MAFGLVYTGQWLMADDATTVTVNIYDTENIIPDGDPVTTIELETTGNPLVISTVNNNREKYGIFSKQAKIEFYSSNTVNAYTFADATDQRWYVEALVGTETLFLGYLVLSEISREFMPNPTVVVLTASDNLGLLKERKLVTTAGINAPTGKHRIADFLAWCLKRTGLNLSIKAVNNVKPGTGTVTIGLANFSNTGFIYFPDPADYQPQFYPGQRLLITSTGANNGTVFTVKDNSSGTYLGSNIEVTPLPVSESGITNFTITDDVTGHIYDKIYLDAKTFEAEIGECEDCYSVLEKIIDKDCFLFQYKGEWWIIRTNEISTDNYFVASYDEDGNYVTTAAGADYEIEIGASGYAEFINAAQTVEYDRPFKFSKHTYRYEYPKEIPCNIDFKAGDLISSISAFEKEYQLNCWTLREGVPGYYGTVDGTTATVHKVFNDLNYELERFVVLTQRTSFESSSINDATYIESEAIPIEIKDRFSASVQWRLRNDIATGANGNLRLFRCVLNGDDGSWWILGEDTVGDGNHKWFNTLNWTVNTAKGIVSESFTNRDQRDWQTINWNAPAAPVTGNVYLWLNQFNQLNDASDNEEVWFNGLSFSYIPFINGSYQKYNGQSSKAERSETGYSANLDEDVSISDSPKPILKGAMFGYDTGNNSYYLVKKYWDSQQWGLSNPNDVSYFQPFEYHRVNATYNQNVKSTRYINGQLIGMDDNWVDLLHKIKFVDLDTDIINRKFMIMSLEQDWKTGRWTAQFGETHHSDGRVFPSFEFKYITE